MIRNFWGAGFLSRFHIGLFPGYKAAGLWLRTLPLAPKEIIEIYASPLFCACNGAKYSCMMHFRVNIGGFTISHGLQNVYSRYFIERKIHEARLKFIIDWQNATFLWQ
jgi:hypothetical protein